MTCIYCGRPIDADHPDNRYCSWACLCHANAERVRAKSHYPYKED